MRIRDPEDIIPFNRYVSACHFRFNKLNSCLSLPENGDGGTGERKKKNNWQFLSVPSAVVRFVSSALASVRRAAPSEPNHHTIIHITDLNIYDIACLRVNRRSDASPFNHLNIEHCKHYRERSVSCVRLRDFYAKFASMCVTMRTEPNRNTRARDTETKRKKTNGKRVSAKGKEKRVSRLHNRHYSSTLWPERNVRKNSRLIVSWGLQCRGRFFFRSTSCVHVFGCVAAAMLLRSGEEANYSERRPINRSASNSLVVRSFGRSSFIAHSILSDIIRRAAGSPQAPNNAMHQHMDARRSATHTHTAASVPELWLSLLLALGGDEDE